MTGQRALAVIHTWRGPAGLEAPNHQSHGRVRLVVALPCPNQETKESGGGQEMDFSFLGVFRFELPCGRFELG